MGLFKNFINKNKQVNEAFNQPPYDYTFGKKNATEVFFTFQEEGEDKEYRIMFAASSGLGKNVRRIFIGERVGTSNTVRNVIKKFKNPMRVIGTLTAAVEEFLMTPMGMKIDGFAIFIPAIAGNRLDEFMKLLFKRNAKIRSKLILIDTKLKLDEKGFYLWTVRKGKNPSEVFTGEQVSGMFSDQSLGNDEPTVTPTQQNPILKMHNDKKVDMGKSFDEEFLSPEQVVEKLYDNLGAGYDIDIEEGVRGTRSVYIKVPTMRSVIGVRATNKTVYLVNPNLDKIYDSSWAMIRSNVSLLVGRIQKIEQQDMHTKHKDKDYGTTPRTAPAKVVRYEYDDNIEIYQKHLNELVANGSTVEDAMGLLAVSGWTSDVLTDIIYNHILQVPGVWFVNDKNNIMRKGNLINIELSLNNYFRVDLDTHKVEYSGMFQDSLKLNKNNNILEISDALNEYMTKLASDISLSESVSNAILPDGYQENVFNFKVKFRSGSPARLYVRPISDEAKEVFGMDEYKTLWFESDVVSVYAQNRLTEYLETTGNNHGVKK